MQSIPNTPPIMIRRCALLTEARGTTHTITGLLQYCSWFPIIFECLSFYDYEQFWTVRRDISKSVYYVSNESLSRRFCLPDLASDLCHIFRQYYGMKSLY